jgi:hypothetical protein
MNIGMRKRRDQIVGNGREEEWKRSEDRSEDGKDYWKGI